MNNSAHDTVFVRILFGKMIETLHYILHTYIHTVIQFN